MSSKPFHTMSPDIALRLIRQWIKPGTPSLSGMFAWVQPSPGDTITTGSTALSFTFESTLRDFLQTEVNHWPDGYQNELYYSPADTKNILRQFPKDVHKYMDKKFTTSGILMRDETPLQFDSLDSENQTLYRLAVMVLNMIGEPLHNWAVEYLEYLSYDNEDTSGFYCYDCDKDAQDFIYAICQAESNSNPLISHWSFYSNMPDYSPNHELGHTSPALVEWIESLVEDDTIADYGLDDIRSYHDSLILVLAACVEMVMESWQEGDLSFSDVTFEDDSILSAWLYQVNNQGVLPGIE